MPHIKVETFDTSLVFKLPEKSDIVEFVASAVDDESRGVLIGVKIEQERFLLLLRPVAQGYMLKYEKVTRPLNVTVIKKAIAQIANVLNLNITHSNITHSENRLKPADHFEKPISFFENFSDFGDRRVCVEVGFGSGRHLLYQAKRDPKALFIGLEIHTPSALQVLKQIRLQGIENVWVVNYDARLFLEMLPSNVLDKIYVHFPVPWDKKPHRRVISAAFVSESLRVLCVGGRLELRTDSDNYFRYALEVLSSFEKIHFEVRKNDPIEVVSKYEARWLRLDKDIYDVHVICEADSEPRSIRGDFNFDIVKYDEGIEECLPRRSLVFGDCFVHIEQLYKIDNDASLLIRLSMGSFDRPEHLYLYMGKEKIRYYPRNPVRTTANLSAHQKLRTILHDAQECLYNKAKR